MLYDRDAELQGWLAIQASTTSDEQKAARHANCAAPFCLRHSADVVGFSNSSLTLALVVSAVFADRRERRSQSSLLHNASLFRLERRHIIRRTWMLWPLARTGHTDVIIGRTWMLWPLACTGHTDVIIARTWMLCWPLARTGYTGVIVRTWMLWPLARNGHTDVIIGRTWMLCTDWSHGCYHRADMDALASRTHRLHGR